MMLNGASPIVVVAEQDQGILNPATHELLAHAKEIQRFSPGPLMAIILGDSVKDAAVKIAETGTDVWAVSAAPLNHYNGEAFKRVLKPLMDEIRPKFVCVAGTSRGSDFAPGLAVRMGAACITRVIGVHGTEKGICFSRAIMGGKFHMDVRSRTRVGVITFETGMIAPAGTHESGTGKIVFKKTTVPDLKSVTLSKSVPAAKDLRLDDAKVVVAAGRGIGDEAHLPLIHQLAACIPQAIVCGSRPVVDMGWLPYSRQVGVTGSTVSPELYIACGISGTAQHTAGMRGSGFIVSINLDPAAAIFQLSDVCIVEDLKKFLPILIETLNKTGKAMTRDD